MIIGWFTRVLVVIAVFAVVGFDTISIASAHLGAQDDANNAASDAASAWGQNHDLAAALAAAQGALNHGETIVPGSLTISASGATTIKIRRGTRTLIAHDIGFLKGETTFVVTGNGSVPS
ncbi:MAG TPA: hypothetical protein VF288_12780 [Mycobacteriales bacterium]